MHQQEVATVNSCAGKEIWMRGNRWYGFKNGTQKMSEINNKYFYPDRLRLIGSKISLGNAKSAHTRAIGDGGWPGRMGEFWREVQQTKIPKTIVSRRRRCRCCRRSDLTSYRGIGQWKKRQIGREPWSSGYGRRLMFQRSWVQIPAPYTGWTFFHIHICCKICNVRLKSRK